MDDIIKADVTAMASELTALSDQAWVDILQWANEHDFTSLDTEQTVRMARILLCAHFGKRILAVGGSGSVGPVGPVISEAAGGVRRAYGNVGGSSGTGALSELSTTPYGLLLATILSSSGVHGPFVC